MGWCICLSSKIDNEILLFYFKVTQSKKRDFRIIMNELGKHYLINPSEAN